MSINIERDEYSYRIKDEPAINEDHDVYVFNGIRRDKNNNEETVRMLFVKKSLSPTALTKYGSLDKIGELPAEYSDDKFHLKYLNDNIVNSNFELYIVTKPPQPVKSPPPQQQQTQQRQPQQRQPQQPADNSSATKQTDTRSPAQRQPQQGQQRAVNRAEKKKSNKLIIIVVAALILSILFFLFAVMLLFIIRSINDENGNKELSSSSTSVSTSDISSSPETSDRLGDINGDGFINSIDASIVLTYYNKLSTGADGSEEESLRGDVNHDGKCDASDASLILGYYSYTSTSNDNNIDIDEYYERYFSNK